MCFVENNVCICVFVCMRRCLSGGVIMLAARPSPPPDLLSRPPSLFIYPGLIQSSGRSVCWKGSLPRQPSVTEQCIRTLRHPLLRTKINHTLTDALEAEKGTSHTFVTPSRPDLQLCPHCGASSDVHACLGLFASPFSVHASHPGAVIWLLNKSLALYEVRS